MKWKRFVHKRLAAPSQIVHVKVCRGVKPQCVPQLTYAPSLKVNIPISYEHQGLKASESGTHRPAMQRDLKPQNKGMMVMAQKDGEASSTRSTDTCSGAVVAKPDVYFWTIPPVWRLGGCGGAA